MACVADPIIGGPRPLPTATTHPPTPTPNTPISLTYYTLKHEEPVNLANRVFATNDGLAGKRTRGYMHSLKTMAQMATHSSRSKLREFER